jgi:UDPglucose 6-dehydrogenase
MKSLLKRPVIFDGRNLFELFQMEEMGFYYESIGRRVVGKK